MKKFILVATVLLLSGCATQPFTYYWRVKDVVLQKGPTVEFYKPDEQIALTLPMRTVQEVMLAHLRINRSANVQSELCIVDGDDPNAFAAPLANGQRIIAINVGMMKLLGSDVNEYAALIGHEAAHWAKGHAAAGQSRTSTLNAIG